MSTVTHAGRKERPLLGLRRQPGRLALWFMRLPQPLYHRGWGRLLGHTFLKITHEGRKTGRRHETVAMALAYAPDTRAVVVCSAWGPNTEWMRNLRERRALQIEIGRETFVPEQRFLSEDEAVAVATEFRDRHPWRMRLFGAILGWGDLSSEPAVRQLVESRPFIKFAPEPAPSPEALEPSGQPRTSERYGSRRPDALAGRFGSSLGHTLPPAPSARIRKQQP